MVIAQCERQSNFKFLKNSCFICAKELQLTEAVQDRVLI